jgi:hypothetical protein
MSWLGGARERSRRDEAKLRRRELLRAVTFGALAGATGIGAFHGSARATMMVEVPFDRLVRESDAIVHGRVIRNGSRLEIDANGAQPHTSTVLEVFEPLKGSVGARLFVDEIGGTVQGRSMWIDGTPRYRQGEECVVFLRALPDGTFRTHAMAQGHFEVRPGVPGVAPRVVRDTSAIGFASWAHEVMEIQPGAVASMPLDAFLAYVREVVGGGR